MVEIGRAIATISRFALAVMYCSKIVAAAGSVKNQVEGMTALVPSLNDRLRDLQAQV